MCAMASSITELSAISVAPDGTRYRLPSEAELLARYEEVAAEAEASRANGQEIVVVQGLGFVGGAVAAAIAAAQSPGGGPRYFVVGVDLPKPAGFWKVARLSRGQSPLASPDPEIGELIDAAVNRDGNLRAVAADAAYGLGDVIVVDVPFHVAPSSPGSGEIEPDLESFEAAIRAIGRHMRPDALVLVESTVPVGTTERIVLPLLEEERLARGIAARPLLAHAYERVMPGPRYLDSIRRFWRVFSATDPESAARARGFLSSFIDTQAFPLRELPNPTSSELAKLLENSYRAANIAFIHEWTLFAERVGVNLFEVIEAIRLRSGTHDNIRQPGFGVGGYCLTKDSLLAQWSARHLLNTDVTLNVTLEALRINQQMPEHTFRLLAELLDGRLQGRRITLCGISYLPEVADTRNSPAGLLLDLLQRSGAEVVLHDPYLASWPERPDVSVLGNLELALTGADGVVLAVPHRPYLALTALGLTHSVNRTGALVDAQNIIDDAVAAELHQYGWRLAGVGKGHWRQRGYQCHR
jgi:UDP-N-acetyl-D-glucosamine dehydrogenase